MNRIFALFAVAALFLMKKSNRSVGTGSWTKNFSGSEFIPAEDMDNVSDLVIEKLQILAIYALQPARNKTGVPIKITSAYRNPARNAAVGGVANSQHVLGEAADIQPIPNTAANFKKLWDALASGPFDQLIWENAKPWEKPTHIHVSYRSGSNRKKKYYYLDNKYYLI